MSAARTLSTADERRETVLEAAARLYAQRGFHGTPTMAVAKAAGISQAYLFRLFPTKDDLAIALVERANERIHDTFAAVAAEATRAGEDPLSAMGMAYGELLQDQDWLMVQLHAFAAAPDMPAIREAMNRSFVRLHELVARETGAEEERIGRFFRFGMAMNVMCALGALESDEDWARVMRDKHEDGTPC
jgi:AcrR family transcriptional regulator